MRKIINHHIEGGTRESHPRVQDLQHPRLDKPRPGLQILDTRMGFPRPSLNVVLDSIILLASITLKVQCMYQIYYGLCFFHAKFCKQKLITSTLVKRNADFVLQSVPIHI